MARDLVRPIPPIVFPTNGGQELGVELPKDSAYKGIMLNFSLNLTHGTGAGLTATASILEVINNIRLVADGKLTLCNIDGFALRELNRIWHGSTPPETAFALATAVYECTLFLPIAQPFFHDSSVGLLPAVPLSGLQLSINCGGVLDLMTAAGNDSFVLTVTGQSYEILDLAPNLAVSPMVMSQIVHNVVTQTGFGVPLRRGNRLAGLLAHARSYNGSTTIHQAGILQRLGLQISAESTGPQILRNESYVLNRGFTRIFGSGVASGQVSDLTAGFMYQNYHADGRATSPLDVSGPGTEVFALVDETAVGTNPQVVFTEIEVIPRPV